MCRSKKKQPLIRHLHVSSASQGTSEAKIGGRKHQGKCINTASAVLLKKRGSILFFDSCKCKLPSEGVVLQDLIWFESTSILTDRYECKRVAIMGIHRSSWLLTTNNSHGGIPAHQVPPFGMQSHFGQAAPTCPTPDVIYDVRCGAGKDTFGSKRRLQSLPISYATQSPMQASPIS